MITLIIEDQREVADLWKGFLADNFKSAYVRCGYNMKEGLELMEQQPRPEVVLLDLNLPDSNPMQTLRNIAALKALNPLAVILVVTGMKDDQLPRIAAAMGADSFNDKTHLRTQVSLINVMKDAFEKRSKSELDNLPVYEESLRLLEQMSLLTISHQ